MRIKKVTLLYFLVAIFYSITPTIILALLKGHTLPEYTVNSFDVLMVFAFTFVPLVVGFIGGEMFLDDMDDSDPLYNPSQKRRGL